IAATGIATAAAAAADASATARAATPQTGRAARVPRPAAKEVNDAPREQAPRRTAPPVLPAPQELPVLRPRRAQDRLQGRQAAATLHLGARQDRAEPDHGGLGQEAARAGAGHKARAPAGAPAVRRQLTPA